MKPTKKVYCEDCEYYIEDWPLRCHSIKSKAKIKTEENYAHPERMEIREEYREPQFDNMNNNCPGFKSKTKSKAMLKRLFK